MRSQKNKSNPQISREGTINPFEEIKIQPKKEPLSRFSIKQKRWIFFLIVGFAIIWDVPTLKSFINFLF